MLNKFSNITSYVLIAGLIAGLGTTIYVLQRQQPQQVTIQAATATFAGGWTMEYSIQRDGLSYHIRNADDTGNPQLCAPGLGQAPRIETWWHAKPSNAGREYFETVGGRDNLGIMHSHQCRETTLDTIRMKETWTQACADGQAAEVTLGIDVETSPRHGPKLNLADFGCPDGAPTATPTLTPPPASPTARPSPTPGARACQKLNDIPLQDCQKPELEKQPTNVKLIYNNDFTFTVTWNAVTNLPAGIQLQEYRLSLVNEADDKAWIGYPQKVGVDKNTTTYTSPQLPVNLRGATFYARVRAIYNDRLVTDPSDCICRSSDGRSEKTPASAGCDNCVEQTVIRYPNWDQNGDGTINDCNEACKAYWGAACDGNSYCGNPGSNDSTSCCACQTSAGTSCDQLPTPSPRRSPTPGEGGPTLTPPGGGPPPGYQPGVCKGEACYSPVAPNVKVYKDLSIGGVKFVFSEQGQPASKYTLRWATRENFDDPNHTKTECCGLSQCTGEQSCGSREACTGNSEAEKSFNPVCDGNQCTFERGGLSPCIEYKADIVAQVNTATCPNKPQATSNMAHFLYSDGTCDDREFGLEGGSPPVPTSPGTQPSATPTSPPGDGYQPPGGSYKCSAVNTGEWCTINKLMGFFRDDPTTGKTAIDKAREAVMVCNKENAGANPNALNDRCLAPTDPLRTAPDEQMFRDYSVGLFQINLLGDKNLFREVRVSDNQPGYQIKDRPGKYVCQAVDAGAVQRIRQKANELRNPVINIQRMVAMSDNGHSWDPWNRAACMCGLPGCNPSLLASEVTGDDYIDAADVAVVMAAYGAQEGEADYDQLADFCGPHGDGADGAINAYEISCLIRDWSPQR